MGIGGSCSAYSEWTPYSRYPPEHRQALANGCTDDGSSGVKGIYQLDLMVAAIMFMLYFL